GAYPHVAAEAWGVAGNVFADWLRQGDEPQASEPYASFAADVRQAHAQARLLAEKRVLDDHAKAWLENGPGREQPDRPGRAGAVGPAELTPAGAVSIWLDSAFTDFAKRLLDVLAPYPEARHAAQLLLPNVAESAVPSF